MTICEIPYLTDVVFQVFKYTILCNFYLSGISNLTQTLPHRITGDMNLLVLGPPRCILQFALPVSVELYGRGTYVYRRRTQALLCHLLRGPKQILAIV